MEYKLADRGRVHVETSSPVRRRVVTPTKTEGGGGTDADAISSYHAKDRVVYHLTHSLAVSPYPSYCDGLTGQTAAC